MVLANKGRFRFWRLIHALLGKADLSPRPYRLLKNDMAAKLSARSRDGITYDLLADEAERQIAFVGNEGDAYGARIPTVLLLCHHRGATFPWMPLWVSGPHLVRVFFAL